MVLGILGAIAGATAIPMSSVALPNAATATSTSTVGVSQGAGASNGGQKRGGKADPNDPRLAKFTLRTHCDEDSPDVRQVHKNIILKVLH